MNFSLGMQKGSKDLLKILKGHRNLQESASKANENNLNDFKNNSESSEDPLESFKDASEGEIEFKDFNEDFDENQLKAE